MKRLATVPRVIAMLAVTMCALAATASSALAISIEPLNTSFETTTSKNPELKTSGSNWKCAKATLAGKTNSTKTNNVNVTPAITGCETAIGTQTHTITYANNCPEGKVPWTLTLTEGKFVGTTKLNCVPTLTIDKGAACVVKVTEQTIAKELKWTTLKETEPFESELKFNLVKMKYVGTGPSKGAFCELLGFRGEAGGENLELVMDFLPIKGIKAV